MDPDDRVERTMEDMIAYGDLIESDTPGDGGKRGLLVYAAPPSFVSRKSGGAILIGINPDSFSPLPPEVERSVEYVKHTRRLRPQTIAEVRTLFLTLGFSELPPDVWLRAPRQESSSQLLARVNSALDAAGPSGDIPGLIILDPDRPVAYYRGRWKTPKAEHGRFVGRRPQAYGAPIWCFVELEEGMARKLLDFPFDHGRWRGSDEAWRVQAAIDAHRGIPQYFRTRETTKDDQILDFFSPVPSWARRRWDAIGDPVSPFRSLFAYRIPQSEVEEESAFCRDRLWVIRDIGTSSAGA
jgi:hypothetical protein